MSMKLFLDPAVTSAAGGTPAPVVEAKPAAVAAAPAPAAPAAPSYMAPPAPKAEEKKLDAAAPAAPAAAPAAPEKYSLAVPEGQKMEAADLQAFEARMQALGVTKDQAQKLLESKITERKASHEADLKFMDTQQSKDLEGLKARWGERYAENDAKLKVVFDYIDPSGAFRKGLSDARMAHNPVLIGALERLIPLFESPSMRPPSSTGVTQQDNRTQREKLIADYEKRMTAAPK